MAAFTEYYRITKRVAPITLLVDYTARGPYYTFKNIQMFSYADTPRFGVRNVWQAIQVEMAAVAKVYFSDKNLSTMFLDSFERKKESMLALSFAAPSPEDQLAQGTFDPITMRIVEMGNMIGVKFVPELDKSNWVRGYTDIKINRAKEDILSGLRDLRDFFTISKNSAEVALVNEVIGTIERPNPPLPLPLGMTALFLVGRYRSIRSYKTEEQFLLRGMKLLLSGVQGLRRFNPVLDIPLPPEFRGLRRI